MTTKNVVVFGGTGHQGGAFVRALAAYNDPDVQYTIHVLSRSPAARGSTRLTSLPGVKIVPAAQNYADDPLAAFKATGRAVGEVYGAFDVQGYMSEADDERQGKAVADAAKDYGVRHFIYASVDHDDTVETADDSFDPKRRVEKHLQAIGLPYTATRATDFMDNWLPTESYVLKCYRTILLRKTFYRDPGTKLQQVSTRDVGRAGALALHETASGSNKYVNTHIRLAADANSMADVERIYKEVLGEAPGEVYGLLAAAIKVLVPSVGRLARFYDQKGYISDGLSAKAIPGMEDFRSFLERYKRERDAK